MADEALQGAAALIAKLRDIGALDDGKALRSAVRAGMRPVVVAARLNLRASRHPHKIYTGATVQPGFARSQVKTITTLSADKQMATAILGVSKEAFYAVQFLELGTSKMPAYPWLRPAFYETKDAQEAALVAKLQAYYEKVAAATGTAHTDSDP